MGFVECGDIKYASVRRPFVNRTMRHPIEDLLSTKQCGAYKVWLKLHQIAICNVRCIWKVP